MRAIGRVVDVSPNTIDKILVEAGRACAALHDEAIRGVTAGRVQCDEIWSFTYAKQKNVATAKAAPQEAGDTWTWTALDAGSKLIVSYFVGDRSGECAMVLMIARMGRDAPPCGRARTLQAPCGSQFKPRHCPAVMSGVGPSGKAAALIRMSSTP